MIPTPGTGNLCAVTKATNNPSEPAVMQLHNERSRTVVDGNRTDDDQLCKLVVVHEVTGGCVAFYPHGTTQLGVRLTKADAVKVAQAILAAAS